MTVLPFLVPGTTGFSLASPSRAYTLDTTGSCCAVFEDELVLASGRPSTCAKNAGAMALITPAHATDWHRGRWRQLPPLSVGRVGGGALVIHGRLLVTGGCDEVKRQFDGGAWMPRCRPSLWVLAATPLRTAMEGAVPVADGVTECRLIRMWTTSRYFPTLIQGTRTTSVAAAVAVRSCLMQSVEVSTRGS